MIEEKQNRCAVGKLADFLEWLWPNDPLQDACYWHDLNYLQGSWASKHISQEDADRIFRAHLNILKRNAPLGWLRAPLYYIAVRIGGRYFWDGNMEFIEDRRRGL